jgi:hypothetical protein
MAIRMAPLPEGARVRVVRGEWPQAPEVTGRTGTVVASSEYRHNQVGVAIDGETMVRYFMPEELVVTTDPGLPPERIAARDRKPLP